MILRKHITSAIVVDLEVLNEGPALCIAMEWSKTWGVINRDPGVQPSYNWHQMCVYWRCCQTWFLTCVYVTCGHRRSM